MTGFIEVSTIQVYHELQCKNVISDTVFQLVYEPAIVILQAGAMALSHVIHGNINDSSGPPVAADSGHPCSTFEQDVEQGCLGEAYLAVRSPTGQTELRMPSKSES